MILLFSITLTFSNSEENKTQSTQAKYEITEVDIFSLETFNANEISVKGLKVGDKTKKLLETLGSPDLQSDFPGGISILEYSKSLGFETTGLIIQVKTGIVTKITTREPFRELLKGRTSEISLKSDVYKTFGPPTEISFMPVKENSARVVKVLSYEEQGINFQVKKDNVLGFTLKLN